MWLHRVTVVLVLVSVINVNADCYDDDYGYDNTDDYDYDYDYWDCPENEYLEENAPEPCKGEYCPLTDKDIPRDQCPPPDPYSSRRIQRCMCDFNYLRNNVNGTCIPPHKCPPIKCTGPHEVLAQMPPTCPGESCERAIMNPARCSLISPRIPVRPKPTCVCKKDFYRNSSGICVPFKECPPRNCPSGEYLDNCPPTFCSGQYCPTSPSSNLTCPPRDKCGTPQCQCNFNSRRNRLGICVPISKCPPFSCKGINEKYQACPRSCPGERCLNYIYNQKCPKFKYAIECKPDCRCKEEHYRNATNHCVPASECKKPGCKGDPNAVKGCDCFNTCKLYKENIACKKVCKPDDCKCKTGYVLNEKTGRCVLPYQCPLVCNGPNEYYACGGACDNVCALLATQNITNCPIKNIRCNDKCYCRDGFARNKNNICVPYDQCEKPIGCNGDPNAVKGCDCGRTCKLYKKKIACKKICKPDDCKCKTGYVRNEKTGKCVLPYQCPLVCNGPNEYYACGGACDNVCALLATQNITHCPIQNIRCNDKCYCRDGFARNKDNICVPYDQCELKCDGPHEHYDCGVA